VSIHAAISVIDNFEMKGSVALAFALALEDTPNRKRRSKGVQKWYYQQLYLTEWPVSIY